MPTTQFRNCFFVLCSKIVLLSLCMQAHAQSQIYVDDIRYMNRPFHFGVTMAINNSDFKYALDTNYMKQYNVLDVQSVKGPGFSVGIVSDLHLSKKFDFRFVPDLAFAEKDLNFTQRKNDTVANKKTESVYIDCPFLFKYKSKPYKDMRMYVISGLKYNIDLQSNADSRKADDQIKIIANDVSLDYGFGFEFHLPMVTIAPEIKLSYGLMNVLKNDDKLIYSAVLKQLHSRMFMFSIHFEG